LGRFRLYIENPTLTSINDKFTDRVFKLLKSPIDIAQDVDLEFNRSCRNLELIPLVSSLVSDTDIIQD